MSYMSSVEVTKYPYSFFDDVRFTQQGLESVVFPERVSRAIVRITKQVCDPEYIKTPVFRRRQGGGGGNGGGGRHRNERTTRSGNSKVRGVSQGYRSNSNNSGNKFSPTAKSGGTSNGFRSSGQSNNSPKQCAWTGRNFRNEQNSFGGNKASPSTTTSNSWNRNTRPVTDNKVVSSSGITFETTKMVKKRGVENSMNKIRSMLNRMTADNYIEMEDEIIDLIDMVRDDLSDDDMKFLCDNIMQTATSSITFVHVYAKLFSKLLTTYVSFRNVFDTTLHEYTGIMDNVRITGDDDDYNTLCDVNKERDMRLVKMTFLKHLRIQSVVNDSLVEDVTESLKTKFEESVKTKEGIPVCEEISDIIMALYGDEQGKIDMNEDVAKWIKEKADMSPKDAIGITYKAIFTFSDLL